MPIDDGAILVGQLLVWAKLSLEKVIPEGMGLADLRMDSPSLFEGACSDLDSLGKKFPSSVFERFGERVRVIGFRLFNDLRIRMDDLVGSGKVDFKAVSECLLDELPYRDYSYLSGEIATFSLTLLGINKGESVYCPLDSSFRMAVGASRITDSVFCEVRNRSPLASILAELNGNSIQVRFGDPIIEPSWIEDGKLQQFDYGAMSTTFNQTYKESFDDLFDRFPERTTNGEVLQIRHLLSQVRKRAVVLVSNSVLFKTSQAERDFKAAMIKTGWLSTVVSLPPGILGGTNCPVSILVFDKMSPQEGVLVVDAGDQHFHEKAKRISFGVGKVVLRNAEDLLAIVSTRDEGPSSKVLSFSELQSNDFNLMAERYLPSTDAMIVSEAMASSETLPLDEVAELIRPQSVRGPEDEEGERYFEIGVADFQDDGYVRKDPEKEIKVPEKLWSQARQCKLRAGDILLAIKGSVGKVGLVPADIPPTWVPGQSLMIVRVRREIADPVIVFRFLRSPIAQAYIRSRSSGSSIRMIQMRDIRTLPVLMIEAGEVQRIKAVHDEVVSLRAEIEKLRQRVEKLEEGMFEDFRPKGLYSG